MLSCTASSLSGDRTEAQLRKKAVILDTDIGDTIDDAWALALLLRAPDVDLKLVLMSFGGEEELINRARVARHLLDTAGAHHVPVGIGVRGAKGLEKCPNLGSYWMPGSDPSTHFLEDGVGAMLDVVKFHAAHSAISPVTIICIGPATNIAAAVRRGGAAFAQGAKLIGQFGKLKACSELKAGSMSGSSLRPPADDKLAVTFDDEADVNSAYDPGSLQEVLRAPFLSITCCTLELVGSASENFSKARYQALCRAQEPLVKAVLALDSKYDTYMRCLGARQQETWYSDLRPMQDLPSMFWDAAVVFAAMRSCGTLSFPWSQAFAQESHTSHNRPVEIAWGWSADVEEDFSNLLVKRLLGASESREEILLLAPGSHCDEQRDRLEASTLPVSPSSAAHEHAGTTELKQGNFVLGLLYFNVFLDMLGFGLILPLMPYLGTKFHADSVGLGLLTSMFSIAKFFGSIAFGMAADRIGKKTTIGVCALGCMVSYLAMGFADDFKVLVLTRGLAGFFSNTVVVAQSIVPGAVPADQMPKHQGYIGAAIGAGIAFGPSIGGGLARFGIRSPIFLTAALCAANFALVLGFMPRFGPARSAASGSLAPREAPAGKARRCQGALQITLVLMSTLAFWLGYASFEALGGLYFADSLNMGPGEFGFVCTLTGVVQLVLLAGMVKPLVRCTGEIGAGALSFTLSALGWLLFMVQLRWLPYVAAVLVGAGFMVQAVQANLLSSMSSPAFVGTLLGVNQAMASLGRIVGPLMAGVIYPYLPRGIWIASASWALLGIMSFLVLLAMVHLTSTHDRLTCPKHLGAEAGAGKDDLERAC